MARNRRIGDTHKLRPQRKKSVIDTVVGENDQGTFGRKTAGKKRRAKGTSTLQCLRIRDAAPTAAGLPLGEHASIGRALGPGNKPLANAAGVFCQRYG
jgi:hypothetical protein